jgi:hypothetical protein
VPGSVVGLLLLFAALGPGFIWVLVSERRTPQAERTPLLETAQLIAVGGLSSLAGAAIALFVFRELDVIVPAALERDGTGYLLLHPLRAFLVLAAGSAALRGGRGDRLHHAVVRRRARALGGEIEWISVDYARPAGGS